MKSDKKSTEYNPNKKKKPIKKNGTKKKTSTTKKKKGKKKKNILNIFNKKKSVKKKAAKKKKTQKKNNNKNNTQQNNTNIINSIKYVIFFVIRKIKIFFLLICKVLLIGLKKIKNFIIKQYNNGIKKKEAKKEKKTIKKEKQIAYLDEELVKLRYRDYNGFAKLSVFFVNRFRVIKFDMKRFKKKIKYGTLKDKILILLMLMLITGFSLVIAFCVYIVTTAPEISNERLYKSNSSVFLDMNGEVFARLGTENREKVTYDYLPQVLIDAIVSAEDSRFFQHDGVDVARFIKAAIGQVLGRSDAGGGSTLTMQVSKNAATSTEASGLAGIKRKFQDIYLSVFVFEKKYTKEQIMEFYVNIPYLGSGTYGVEQASKAYFGKSVTDLNLVEAATIAGLFQAPDSYDPLRHPEAAQNRRNTILNLMCRHGYITEEERDLAKSIPVASTLVKSDSSYNEYLDFIDTVRAEISQRLKLNPATTSMTIYTTMDPKRQDAINLLMSGEAIPVTKNTTWKFPNEEAQAGIAVISVETGALVAVGASRSNDQLAYNFATAPDMKRHPGSTAKPVIDYGPAIEYLNWGSGTTVIDDKYTYTGGGQIKNFDNGHKGIMTIETALAQSRNIPALYTFQQTTNEQKLTFSHNLNWYPEDSNGYINESTSIGGFNGVNPLQVAAAYATFARGGTYIEPYSYTKIEITETGEVYEVKPKKIEAMSEATAYIINMMLKYAVDSKSVDAGSVSGTDYCAKTGTTTVDAAAKKAAGIKGDLIGDSWEVGYSPDYAFATWYGYKEQYDPVYHLTGTEGGTARKSITKYLAATMLPKNSKFTKPSSVATVEIELETDPVMLASEFTPTKLRSTAHFKKGYEPTEESDRFSKLSSPSNATYTIVGNQVTITWKAATLPNAANINYLTEYFNKGVYAYWADKYLQERLTYNATNIGAFGYEIYMVTSSGTTDLGFTPNTTFTTNIPVDSNVSFIIKSSYQIFKANQSDGITVKIDRPTNAGGDTSGLSVEFAPSCVTVDAYKNMGPNPANKIKVTYNGQDVTTSANITATCSTESGAIDCNNMVNGNKYFVTFKVTYNGINREKQITINPTC